MGMLEPGSDAWMAQVGEEALEPGRAIIDPHHHLWKKRFGRDYLLDEFRADTGSGHNIVKSVFMECRAFWLREGPAHLRPSGETRYIAELARLSDTGGDAGGDTGRIRGGGHRGDSGGDRDGCASGDRDRGRANDSGGDRGGGGEKSSDVGAGGTRVAGIVAHADLRLANTPLLGELLDLHEEICGGRLRGIRQSAAVDRRAPLFIDVGAPAGLYANPDFRAGLRLLAARGLVFDAWHYHHQMRDFIELAKALPECTFVLDHFGSPLGVGPWRRDALFPQWRKDMAELARCENVFAKLGGLAMPDNGFGWHKAPRPPDSDEFVAAQKRWYLHTIDCFDPKRCMFESNFPVDRLSIGYGVLWNGFKKMVADFSEEEKQALFHDTAARVYSI